MKETLYSIDEVVLIPAVISDVDSRSKCNCYYSGGKLPLFIAPMSCLVDTYNYETFARMGFNVILPRNIEWKVRKYELRHSFRWIAVGLEEVEDILRSQEFSDGAQFRISIDIANGHQRRTLNLCKQLRQRFPAATIMVGNLANPKTYQLYAEAGVDFVRIGIGSGQVCTTSVQTGMHYPMASLISKCREVKDKNNYKAQIVADGGFGYIDQIVKGLALGADYVMIGKIAASFPEACGKVRFREEEGFPKKWHREREYYGMSTEKAQKLMHPEPDYVPKHTEGTVRWVPIISDTQKWIDDFTHALKCSMSYNSSFKLSDYIGNVEWGIQNPITFNAYITGKHVVPGF